MRSFCSWCLSLRTMVAARTWQRVWECGTEPVAIGVCRRRTRRGSDISPSAKNITSIISCFIFPIYHIFHTDPPLSAIVPADKDDLRRDRPATTALSAPLPRSFPPPLHRARPALVPRLSRARPLPPFFAPLLPLPPPRQSL